MSSEHELSSASSSVSLSNCSCQYCYYNSSSCSQHSYIDSRNASFESPCFCPRCCSEYSLSSYSSYSGSEENDSSASTSAMTSSTHLLSSPAESSGISLTAIADQWEIGPKIGDGGFGNVYRGKDIDSGSKVAIKICKSSRLNWSLQNEFSILQDLRSSQTQGFPNAIYYGQHHGNGVMVMEFLGCCVANLREAEGGPLQLGFIFKIAIQLLDRLEYIHDKGYIHRDIKPDNLMMGRGDHRNRLYLIDFGLAKRFRHEDTGDHIQFRTGKRRTGTHGFCSINDEKGFELSRRDDLISMGYTLVALCTGSLPWISSTTREARGRHYYQTRKEETCANDLAGELSGALVEFLQAVKLLSFECRPDYAMLKGLFLDALLGL